MVRRLSYFCFGLFAFYLASAFVILSLKSEINVNDAVSALKIISLLSVIWVNGELIMEDDAGTVFSRKANSAIIVFIILPLLLLLFISYFDVTVDGRGRVAPFFMYLLNWLLYYLTWLSITPLVAYAVLDLYFFTRHRHDPARANMARTYVVFHDFVCLLPLTIIAVLGLFFMNAGVFSKEQLEILVNGALASTLFASTIATKSIEYLHERL